MTFVLYILLLILDLVKAASHSPTRSQSPTGFDWKSFLVDSPEHADTSSNFQSHNDSPQLENSSISPILPNEPSIFTKNPSLPPTTRSTQISEAEKKEIARIKTNLRSKKYRNKIKQLTGFTSKTNARLHHLRILEKNGQIDQERKDILNKYRETVRNNMRRSKLQKYELSGDPLSYQPKL